VSVQPESLDADDNEAREHSLQRIHGHAVRLDDERRLGSADVQVRQRKDAAARQFAQSLITAYDVKCPSPEARVRLLSGGNMQKLILGRALDGDPAIIIANQPTRGLDVGAVAYVHSRLIEARDRGAAIL